MYLSWHRLSAKDWVADNLSKRMAKDGPPEVFTGDQAEGPSSLSGQSNLRELFSQVPEVAAPSKKLRRKYKATFGNLSSWELCHTKFT